jgi:hypothetical protein
MFRDGGYSRAALADMKEPASTDPPHSPAHPTSTSPPSAARAAHEDLEAWVRLPPELAEIVAAYALPDLAQTAVLVAAAAAAAAAAGGGRSTHPPNERERERLFAPLHSMALVDDSPYPTIAWDAFPNGRVVCLFLSLSTHTHTYTHTLSYKYVYMLIFSSSSSPQAWWRV